jgi:hypothetical protein
MNVGTNVDDVTPRVAALLTESLVTSNRLLDDDVGGV